MQRRATFLRRAIETLNLEHADVIQERAEEVGRHPQFRGTFNLVTARGFGPPAVTAECAAPLLRVGGLLVVSDPPTDQERRWHTKVLDALGLRLLRVEQTSPRYSTMEQVEACPAGFPRRPGMPQKRPLG